MNFNKNNPSNQNNSNNSNRKYLTSTGMLLKTLASEDSMTNGLINNNFGIMNNSNSINNNNNSMMGSFNNNFSHNPSHYGHHHQQQQQQGFFPPPNQASQFMNINQQYQKPNFPDVMILPNSTSQQRWQQKSKLNQQQQPPLLQSIPPIQKFQQQNKNNQQHSKNKQQKLSNNNNKINTPPHPSVTELPETFGLPTNSYKSSFASSSNKTIKTSDILIDDRLALPPPVTNSSNESLNDKRSQQNKSPQSDIEIISEAYPSVNLINQTTALNNSRPNAQNQLTVDDLFKQYLTKNYNSILAFTTKPQSNFISNFSCLNQTLKQLNFYDNKLKRFKPYSANIKSKDLESMYKKLDAELDKEDGEENNEDDEEMTTMLGENENSNENERKKLKTTQLIVIDDTGDDMHKPWITPELINLIKHRNLLQAKINERNLNKNNGDEEMKNDENEKGADDELIQKFKNLRNKVSKLVKKSRKEYLAKYIKESKIVPKPSENNNNSNSEKKEKNDETTNKEQHPNNSSSSTTILSTTSTTTITTTTTTASANNNTDFLQTSIIENNKEVNNIMTQLTKRTAENEASFLKNQSTLMTSLYNQYYNEYIKQYTEQQKKAQELQQKAVGADEETMKSEYDQLQKQATYYAQQQAAVQSQLEKTLQESSQQLIKEITDMIAKQTTQQIPSRHQLAVNMAPPPSMTMQHPPPPFGLYPPPPPPSFQQMLQKTPSVGQLQPALLPVPPNVGLHPTQMPLLVPPPNQSASNQHNAQPQSVGMFYSK